jgi:hypothetical protein
LSLSAFFALEFIREETNDKKFVSSLHSLCQSLCYLVLRIGL